MKLKIVKNTKSINGEIKNTYEVYRQVGWWLFKLWISIIHEDDEDITSEEGLYQYIEDYLLNQDTRSRKVFEREAVIASNGKLLIVNL